MLIRLVRMTIIPENIGDFEKLFESVRPEILAYPGCRGVELIRDTRFPNVVATLSRWDDDDSLQSYRQSDLFESTWARTKPLFAAPPRAHSYHPVTKGADSGCNAEADSERAARPG